MSASVVEDQRCPCCELKVCKCKFSPVSPGGVYCSKCQSWWPNGLLREPKKRKEVPE